ncbi:sex hormone-binding globulin isoform X1 [Fundulus heteroclitus]|uniref:sex hormone-binding globulin isoform X1 n=1 Tax=Fundulus heteroclitus TaxID=8078 RepID=UPI00165A8BF7|nr:sex hormone-binding globulin isoform X1 [Fundulus heteroclitus]
MFVLRGLFTNILLVTRRSLFYSGGSIARAGRAPFALWTPVTVCQSSPTHHSDTLRRSLSARHPREEAQSAKTTLGLQRVHAGRPGWTHRRMAVFWKAVAGSLLLAVCLMGGRVDGQGNGKKEVSGDSIIYLGQERNPWRPLIRTTANLTELRSIKSSFQFRTFDPEGVIFYGDTKHGEDWFVLSLKEGLPVMQISKEDVQVSVTGGPKLNDGKWHTLDVSNKGKFVILEVDGSPGLVVGMHSKQTKEVVSGQLRLALGGILTDKEKMIVEFEPQMDGCVREGRWLNLSMPWEADADELRVCHQNIQPGSFFAGEGFTVFNTSSVFPVEEDQGFRVELWGDFSQMDGTVVSLMSSQEELLWVVTANNNTNEVHVAVGEIIATLRNTFKRLQITILGDLVKVIKDAGESDVTTYSYELESRPGYLTTLREGRLAIGGLLGGGKDMVGSHFLTGCLEKIQVQGKDLDLDSALIDMSASSHSCPA